MSSEDMMEREYAFLDTIPEEFFNEAIDIDGSLPSVVIYIEDAYEDKYAEWQKGSGYSEIDPYMFNCIGSSELAEYLSKKYGILCEEIVHYYLRKRG